MLNKKKYIICSLIGILLSLFLTIVIVNGKREILQREVASEVLRFHVLANSDSKRDQELKMKVKEEVLAFMEKELPNSESLEMTRIWAKEHISEIEKIGRKVLLENNCAYPVKAEVTFCEFPEKTYGDITFPSGTYEALRIEIGEGKGQNWWCVLYPNLCFIDAIHAVVPEEGKDDLEEVLDEEAYEMVTSDTIFRIKWFFF